MAACAIFIRDGEIVDPAAMPACRENSAASAPNPVMKVHAVNGDMECLGKEGADGMVIPAFPTFERAREGYCGPHQVRSRLRQRAAPNRGFIVQGVSA